MSRFLLVLALLQPLAAAQEIQAEKPPAVAPDAGVLLETQLRRGQRFAGSNTVSFTLVTTQKQGQAESSEFESVERTERFVDEVLRAEMNGVVELDRTYTKLFTKARTSADSRPDVHQNPLQGQKVRLLERAHRRDLKLEGRGAIDTTVRRTAGMELDWRDILPEDPVQPGDAWDADAGSLARALAAYLSCGTRSKMRVRFEEILDAGGSKQAKLYVDWTVEGMRDKNLFTKVTLAGDVYFDLQLKRVVRVDLAGGMIVRGAIIGQGAPKIIKGEGQVLVKTGVRPADVEAAPEDEEDEEGLR
jgi:hypothetical protein